MEYRTLDITLISAKGLKNASLFGKMDVYAVASIADIAGNVQKLKTHVDKDGGSDPSWNFPMKFFVDEAAGLQNRLTLVVAVMHAGAFGDKEVGRVSVPVSELLEGIAKEGKSEQLVSYRVRTMSGKPKGSLNVCYKFGEKFTREPVHAYPVGMPVGSSSSLNSGYQQAYAAPTYPVPSTGYAGYGYQSQQQQPGYGYPPPPPPGYNGYPGVQQPQQAAKKNKLGMGLGAGLLGGALGGLLIADIASDAGGGGCGGGGCGGGCGG